MSKVANLLFNPTSRLNDPFDIFGRRKKKAKKKAEKAEDKAERKRERRSKVLSDQAFRESTSLLGGRAGSTQAGTILGG